MRKRKERDLGVSSLQERGSIRVVVPCFDIPEKRKNVCCLCGVVLQVMSTYVLLLVLVLIAPNRVPSGSTKWLNA